MLLKIYFNCRLVNNHTQANTIIQSDNPLVGRWESIYGTIDNKVEYTKEEKRVKYYHSNNTYHVDKIVDGVEKTFTGGSYKVIDANNYEEIIDEKTNARYFFTIKNDTLHFEGVFTFPIKNGDINKLLIEEKWLWAKDKAFKE